MNKILITGASGFIGSNLSKYLADRGLNAFSGVRKPTETINESKKIEFNLDNISKLDLNGFSTIIHTAGIAHNKETSEKDFEKYNHRATIDLANKAIEAGVSLFIFISSIGVVATSSRTVLNHRSPAEPKNQYSQSKYNAEVALKKLSSGNKKFNVFIIRPPLVYGPDAPGNYKMLRNAILKKIPLPLKDVKNRRSFCHINNLNSLIHKMLLVENFSLIDQNTFMVADDEVLSTSKFINYIGSETCINPRLFKVNTTVLRIIFILLRKKSIIASLLEDLEIDTSRTKEVFPWRPKSYIK